MRKWFIKIIALALPLTFAVSSQTDAAALYDGNAFYKSQGFSSSRVASMPWWEDSSVTTYGYAGILSTARNSWDAAPSANIGYNKTSSELSAYLRFYLIDDPYAGYDGQFKPFDSNGNAFSDSDADNPNKSFYKSNLILNDYNLRTYYESRAQRVDIAVHELGHSFNLKHQDNDVQSIMNSRTPGREAPYPLDYRNVGWKY
ncbi:hypothetical protein MHH57_17835 [Paenibacillus sp. FSL H7-0442]|uniref:hypothetical protein n=1 Tax=Paenibacillus sp. FSL H7-0442 TaxID=2921435 RepID=UPI003158A759